MSKTLALFVGFLPFMFIAATPALAQHAFAFTIVVDPSGNADETMIQDAIDSVEDNPNDHYTILIYAGTYNENITLDSVQENIDLIGVDRNAVIIAPSSGDGIVITSGTETSRNNAIRNLTINTTSGHGIYIEHAGSPAPADIDIEGVTINAAGSGSEGIHMEDAANVSVTACTIDSAAGHGIELYFSGGLDPEPTNITIDGSTITANASGQNGVEGTAVGLSIRNSQINSVLARGINLGFVNGFVLADSSVVAGLQGVSLSVPTDILIVGSQIESGSMGVELYDATDPLRIADSSITVKVDNDSTSTWCIRNDTSASATLIVERTRLEFVQKGSGYAAAIATDAAAVTFIDCDIIAHNTGTGKAYGVDATRGGPPFQIIGGSITSQADDEKQTEVWDIFRDTQTDEDFSVSRVEFSKWKGTILASGRKAAVTQRTVNVIAAGGAKVHTGIALTGAEQEIETGITDPDVYRTLSVTGNASGMDQYVYIIGTNWGGDEIVERIKLTGTTAAKGVKPFKTVTKIIAPVQSGPGEVLTVGTTDRLGLYYPLSATTDVVQESLLVSGVYTNQTLGTVDTTYSTVVPSSFSAGDSFEWALLTTP